MQMTDLELYRSMKRIRRFEETILEEFKRGVFSGTTHTSIGQEANAVGVISNLEEMDIIVTNHRCHGHYLAYGGAMHPLFAEMMGRQTGLCAGRGGSQHIHWRNLYSNGVQGGIVPIATGMALAEKRKGTGAIVTVFLGDGTLGEGVIYEAFNMASLWRVPILFVVENNHISQTTPSLLNLAGKISTRFEAFDIPAQELDTSDVVEIRTMAVKLITEVRSTVTPRALILNTERFGPHSKGDDTRPEEELLRLRATRDPLIIHGKRIDPGQKAIADAEIEKEVRLAFDQALADPLAVFEQVRQ